ncbi:MAG: glycoside hydrolase family 5 protein [Lachnospiraceae bacterium]|nr:glycoside hydrolase family 5 protein [Lachnospiraceae bacterium]
MIAKNKGLIAGICLIIFMIAITVACVKNPQNSNNITSSWPTEETCLPYVPPTIEEATSSIIQGGITQAPTQAKTEDTTQATTQPPTEAPTQPPTEAPTLSEAYLVAQKLNAGINIGNALDAYGSGTFDDMTDYELSWHNPRIIPELFVYIKELGFDTVRIPVTWFEHIDANGKIDSAWMKRVCEVVDFALDADLYVIINAHHDKWYMPFSYNKENSLAQIENVWGQIAMAFRDYEKELIFEGFNEPRLVGTSGERGFGDASSYEIINANNAKFVEVVRKTGGNNVDRYLMLTSYMAANNKVALNEMIIPEDDRLLWSCHAYTPIQFTHKDGNTNNWDEDDYDSVSGIKTAIRHLKAFIEDNNIPVVVTEFGAVYKGNEADREAWCRYIVDAFSDASIPYIWWDNNYIEDYPNTYGLIDREKLISKYPNIIKILTRQDNR